MAQVRVVHSIGDLKTDLMKIPARMVRQGNQLVRRNVAAGSRETRRIARQKSSKQRGSRYYKRISSEMTGVLEGEYGPSAVKGSNYVGAGWRSGENTDLPRSMDIVVPKFHKDVEQMVDDLFWETK